MDIFDYANYRVYLRNRLKMMPKQGHGQMRKLAEHMGVHTTFTSQVLSDIKSLSLEQGVLAAEFIGLNEIETEYFLKLIQLDRAGNEKLRKLLQRNIEALRSQARKISSRLEIRKVLADEEKAIFYSDWYYSAIRLLVNIKGFQSIEPIAEYLQLPKKTVADVLNFLVASGLLKKENERFLSGPSRTHLEADSPFIKIHHTNWRQKALESVKSTYSHRLHYSSPMTVGKKDVELIRQKIVAVIAEIGKVIDSAPNEELMCINIDWFKIQNQTE